MLLTLMFVTTISFASNEPKEVANSKPKMTDIPFIQKSNGMFLFTSGQILAAFNYASATQSQPCTYTSYAFMMDGSYPVLYGKGYRNDTPSISIITAIVLVDGGITWDLPPEERIITATCVAMQCCTGGCEYLFSTQKCNCKQADYGCFNDDTGYPLGDLSRFYKCNKTTTTSAYYLAFFSKVSSY